MTTNDAKQMLILTFFLQLRLNTEYFFNRLTNLIFLFRLVGTGVYFIAIYFYF
jgi:hypothetical protein